MPSCEECGEVGCLDWYVVPYTCPRCRDKRLPWHQRSSVRSALMCALAALVVAALIGINVAGEMLRAWAWRRGWGEP